MPTFKKYAKIVFIAAWDMERIINSGEHGAEVLAAILSEMREPGEDSDYSQYFAISSMTYDQMLPFFSMNHDAAIKAKRKTVSVAVNRALDKGGLVRLKKGAKGKASVYTFNVYVTAVTCEDGNLSDLISYRYTPDKLPLQGYKLPLHPSKVTVSTCEEGGYPYSSITIHNHPQGAEVFERPTIEQFTAYCIEHQAPFDIQAEYNKLQARDFKDAKGEPIRYWGSYVDALIAKAEPYRVEPKTRKNAPCVHCGNKITYRRTEGGTYETTCPYCMEHVTISETE